jgi:release factor glutamine methyltransferase
VTLGEALREGARRLAGRGDGVREARLLMAHLLGLTPEQLFMAENETFTDRTVWESLLARRLNGEPVTRIIGARSFWGRSFRVTPDVLDPRPDTETLIEAALGLAVPERVLDLGTGSGCLAVTLLAEWPTAFGVATDLSGAALKIAAENAARHDVADRLELVQSNWWAEVSGTYDLIVSNPPYIRADEMAGLGEEVLRFDPVMALTPGGDGLQAYRDIAEGLTNYLRPSGTVMVEIGWEQGADVCAIFSAKGLSAVEVLRDMEGRDRVVRAKRD